MKFEEKSDPETEFLSGLIELQYGQEVSAKLKGIASQVNWAKGWPENKKAFWNAEAFMWSKKISKEKKELIIGMLGEFVSENNLDVGSGAYSYFPSIGFDLSKKMLDFNDNCKKKIVGDLEESLSFENCSFSSVTAIFVLNYVNNYTNLLNEINRVLADGGYFLVVLSAKAVNEWQRQKEVNNFTKKKWIEILENIFDVEVKEKGNLLFFVCKKTKSY